VIGIELWADSEAIHMAWQSMVDDPDRYTPCGWDLLATYRMECREFPFYLCPLRSTTSTPGSARAHASA
jgi:hypothetical protein